LAVRGTPGWSDEKALYRYYVCVNAQQRGWNKCQTRSVSAPLLEDAVVDQIRCFAQRPEMLSEVLRRLEENRQQESPLAAIAEPADVRDALLKFNPLWDQLNGWEQEQLIRALVEEVRYDGPSGTETVSFLSEGIRELCQGDKTRTEGSSNEEHECV